MYRLSFVFVVLVMTLFANVAFGATGKASEVVKELRSEITEISTRLQKRD